MDEAAKAAAVTDRWQRRLDLFELLLQTAETCPCLTCATFVHDGAQGAQRSLRPANFVFGSSSPLVAPFQGGWLSRQFGMPTARWERVVRWLGTGRPESVVTAPVATEVRQ